MILGCSGWFLGHSDWLLTVSSKSSQFPNLYDILLSRHGLGLSFDISQREFFTRFIVLLEKIVSVITFNPNDLFLFLFNLSKLLCRNCTLHPLRFMQIPK